MISVRVCEEYKEWVEDRWEEPVSRKKRDSRRRCKRKKCKKWCLCCNKWKCWVETFFYWVTEWIIRIVAKWLVYTVCRIISFLITAGMTILKWGKDIACIVGKAFRVVKVSNGLTIEMLPLRTLELEVVIIDSDDEQNPIAEAEINERIANADRILKNQAKIEVKKSGEIIRQKSNVLYIVSSGVGDYFAQSLAIIGRNSATKLTAYFVKKIEGTSTGLQNLFFGSVFVELGSPATTLCHEIGHATLPSISHHPNKNNLMYEDARVREDEVEWPKDVVKLTEEQACKMRNSRWLNWTWTCSICPSDSKTYRNIN